MKESPQSYRAVMDWLNSRQQLGIVPGLDRVSTLLEAVGRPHVGPRFIHVAGTNGKGSVATLLAETLRRSGHRTGLYTSPHLIEFGERILVDGRQIATHEVVRVIETIRPAIDDMDRAGTPPTFFEICTAAAFVHFRAEEVSWAVIETGMGGRADATNVIDPELTIITNVELDHTHFLGDDLETIAAEKAGIITEGVPILTGATAVALEVIEKEAARVGAPVVSLSHQAPLAAKFHTRNTALVVAACELLREQGIELSEEAVGGALTGTTLPGRLETIPFKGVEVIIDGAHNVAASEAIAAELGTGRRVLDLVVGFNKDKDWQTMLEVLVPLTRRVWAVPVRSPRTLDPGSIESALPPELEVATASSVEDALDQAVAGGADRVLVTGSMFLAGEARAVLTGHDLTEVGGSQ